MSTFRTGEFFHILAKLLLPLLFQALLAKNLSFINFNTTFGTTILLGICIAKPTCHFRLLIRFETFNADFSLSLIFFLFYVVFKQAVWTWFWTLRQAMPTIKAFIGSPFWMNKLCFVLRIQLHLYKFFYHFVWFSTNRATNSNNWVPFYFVDHGASFTLPLVFSDFKLFLNRIHLWVNLHFFWNINLFIILNW